MEIERNENGRSFPTVGCPTSSEDAVMWEDPKKDGRNRNKLKTNWKSFYWK